MYTYKRGAIDECSRRFCVENRTFPIYPLCTRISLFGLSCHPPHVAYDCTGLRSYLEVGLRPALDLLRREHHVIGPIRVLLDGADDACDQVMYAPPSDSRVSPSRLLARVKVRVRPQSNVSAGPLRARPTPLSPLRARPIPRSAHIAFTLSLDSHGTHITSSALTAFAIWVSQCGPL